MLKPQIFIIVSVYTKLTFPMVILVVLAIVVFWALLLGLVYLEYLSRVIDFWLWLMLFYGWLNTGLFKFACHVFHEFSLDCCLCVSDILCLECQIR